MLTRYRLDRESFGALLANAFAVQESGIDKPSLASLVEIEQFIASEVFDFDEEMRMVADRVYTLSRAAGVAVALLRANQLVYCAGVGSATKQVGRRVAAVLNVSSSGHLPQEILRVEDAAKDKRIDADICRQLGARSLLMLPIYENRTLKGILEVLFDDAHSFFDPEIRVYRLMASALEQGILRRQQQVKEHQPPSPPAQACSVEVSPDPVLPFGDQTVRSSICPSSAEHNVFHAHCPTNTRNHFAMEQSKESQVYLRIATGDGSHPWSALKSAASSTVSWRSSTLLWCLRIAPGVAVVLGVVMWTSSGNHPLHLTACCSPDTALRENEQPASNKLLSAKQGINPRIASREIMNRISEFKHVRISPDEVDEVAEDVTIRRFTTKSTKPQLQGVVKEVSLGDDVTIRYFSKGAAAVFKPTNLGTETNQKPQQPQ